MKVNAIFYPNCTLSFPKSTFFGFIIQDIKQTFTVEKQPKISEKFMKR